MKSLIQNWPAHNLFGHPLMQIFLWLGFDNLASQIHDNTLPIETELFD